MGADLLIRRALLLSVFAPAHRPSPFVGKKFAQSAAAVTFNPNMNSYGTRA
jgi:hypothetical protein